MFLFSEPVTLFLICSLVVMFIKHLLNESKMRKYRFPPGPPALPFVGNVHMLDIKRQDFSFMKMAEKYGPFFTFHFGNTKAVVLVGYDAVKEALVGENYAFGNRGAIAVADDFQHGHGVIFSNGELWKATRRFTLSILRDLGMGKRPIESRISEELEHLNKLINSFKGNPFPQTVFRNAPPNITLILMIGRRFDYDNPTFRTLVQLLDDIVVLSGSPSAQYYSFLPKLKPFLRTPAVVAQKADELKVVFKQLLEETKQMMDKDSFTTYTEAFLQKDLQETKKEGDGKLFHEKNLLASMFDLALGGTETTTTTLQWGVLLMMKYPHIQKKAQDEIENVIGLERPPRWDDQKYLPYCLAVVHEIQRFGNILQYMLHSTLTDTHFRGYFLPKGTPVIPLFTSVLYDETQWATPREFNPNHFLDADGKFLKRDAFWAFSKGRRVCAGESLARMELFLFFTGLLQKFTFTTAPGVDKADLNLTADVFFLMRPKHYNVCAIPRQ